MSAFTENPTLQAPLGLTWGMTKAQAESLCGHCFGYDGTSDSVHSFVTESPPAPVAFADSYTLHFIPDSGLQFIATKKAVANDVSGRESEKVYNEIKAQLIAQHGEIWKEDDEPVTGANWKFNDGGWMRLIHRPNTGSGNGSGYVDIEYVANEWIEFLHSKMTVQ